MRACLDWTERRPHLAGAVGAALCSHALTAGWVTRIGTTRALAVTVTGRRAWHDHLGLPLADLSFCHPDAVTTAHCGDQYPNGASRHNEHQGSQ